MWYGPQNDDEIDWVHNEKFGWCWTIQYGKLFYEAMIGDVLYNKNKKKATTEIR